MRDVSVRNEYFVPEYCFLKQAPCIHVQAPEIPKLRGQVL